MSVCDEAVRGDRDDDVDAYVMRLCVCSRVTAGKCEMTCARMCANVDAVGLTVAVMSCNSESYLFLTDEEVRGVRK